MTSQIITVTLLVHTLTTKYVFALRKVLTSVLKLHVGMVKQYTHHGAVKTIRWAQQ